MKLIQKYLYWFLCTAVLGAIVLFGFLQTEEHLPLKFRVASESGIEEISVFDAEDGNYYVFLPSYADMERTTIALPPSHTFTLAGIPLTDGMACGNYELETPYALTNAHEKASTLWFYQSANVATMYIDTATGTMTRIHEDKNYKEDATVTLYESTGDLHHLDMPATLKGRGNTTWDSAKKAYTLELAAEESLLGMSAATRWVLLSNTMDETNLRNKLVFDLAEKVGGQWSPDNAFIDVYLNGEYNGLYLLTEKLEVGSNRLDIDTEAGDFLVKIEHSERWDSLKDPFTTQLGRTVEISSPEMLTQDDKDRVTALTNQLEAIILSGADLRTEPSIDLDSFIRRYLIDEISANIDADSNSSYFYYSDGVFYGGPFWDYDLTFGITRDRVPNVFTAYLNVPGLQWTPYYRALYENNSFYQKMTEVYRSEFLPVLEEMINGGIYETAAVIETASQMNRIRWKSMYDGAKFVNSTIDQTAEELCTYFSDRVDFLNSAWIDNTEYHTVCFNPVSDTYWTVAVKAGEPVKMEYANLEHTEWFHAETGALFDPAQPITEDMLLVRPTSDSGIGKGTIVAVFVVSMLIFLLLCMAIVDIRRRSEERRQTDGPSRAKISS